MREYLKVSKDELLRMGVFSGQRLEKEVEKFLLKHGETALHDTSVCVLRRLEIPGNRCTGCSSSVVCKKKSLIVMALAIFPAILVSEISSAHKEEMCEYTSRTVERILQASSDEELDSILDDM